ncbi:TlpA disulfide reductase family protein [Cellulomonas sp. ES6]|uniref:TlpA family protein disulfide reductase n=1 Tax=Cellulomonas sp. ES6 TaxID=3039384 RepID=UPI0024B68FFE|nr:TlpA disulfide reductase family protein [Cellulomonas sp. ES6]WHP16504.1 TlpA disulfide reductase family protein [Cellulomonas sp. ES6]
MRVEEVPAGRRHTVRPTPGRARRTAVRGLLFGTIAAISLAGCTSAVTGGWTEDGTEAGYVSGDGTVAMWDAADRGEPVRLVGTDFAGADVDTGAWAGDVVVINTWYAACPPCRAEAPDLVAAATDYADEGVHFIGINGTDDAGAAQPFERNFQIPYPSIHDADGTAIAALQGRVPVEAVPTTVVLDRQARVMGRIIGRLDPTTLRELIDTALAETP